MDQILKSKPNRHVLVIHKGLLYKVDAFDEFWRIRPENDIMGDLSVILEQAWSISIAIYKTLVPGDHLDFEMTKKGEKRHTESSICSLTTLDRSV